jgi:hypothetical protein
MGAGVPLIIQYVPERDSAEKHVGSVGFGFGVGSGIRHVKPSIKLFGSQVTAVGVGNAEVDAVFDI